MGDAKEIIKEAGTRCGEVLKMLGENYLQSAIATLLTPIVTNAVQSLDDEFDKKLFGKKEEKEDKLDVKIEEKINIFAVELDKCSEIKTGWNYAFTAYTLYCVRIGTDKDGAFLCLGQKYIVAYKVLQLVHKEVKKEFPEAVIPDLPPDCLFGKYCLCLTRNGDINATQNTMSAFLNNISKEFGTKSKTLSDTFYMGDKYEIQQKSKSIFDDAFANTRDEIVKGEYVNDIDPFDEGEAINQLLRSIARTEFLPKLRAKVPNVPLCYDNMVMASDAALLAAIDTTMAAAWPPLQVVVNKGKEVVIDLITQGGEKLVEEMKVVLTKILEVVKSKLEKKEEKKDEKKDEKEDKKKKTQIGDFVKNWRFERSEIGKKFHHDLKNSDAKAALEHLSQHINQAITDFIEKKLQEGAQKLVGDKAGSYEIVQEVIAYVADQAAKVVKRYTTITTPLMNAAKSFFEVRAEFEVKLSEAKGAEALEKVIDEGSMTFYKKLPHIAIKLFKDTEKVKSDISQELRNLPATALAPLTDAVDTMYQLEMKALNCVRVQMIASLKTKVKQMANNELKVDEALRSTFNEFVFSNTQALVEDAWCVVADAIIKCAYFQVMAKFDEKVWVHVKPPLQALQDKIPAPLTKAGLKIEPLAHKVAGIIIDKPTKFITTKLSIKLEEILFNQAESV